MNEVENVVSVMDEDDVDELFDMAKKKIDNLINDYVEYYKPKGKGHGLEVSIKITKPNFDYEHNEVMEYRDNLKVFFTVEVGTKKDD